MNNFNLDCQLLDIISSGKDGRRKLAQNPFNIIWLLEQSPTKEALNLVEKLKSKTIKEKTTKKVHPTSPLAKILGDEALIIKRVACLVEEGLDIGKYASELIAFKSLSLLQYAVSCGMDFKNKNLFEGMETRKREISSYLYPLCGKDYRDEKGNNAAHIAVKTRDYHILERLMQDYPELIYEKNSLSLSAVDNLMGDKYYDAKKNKGRHVIEGVLDAHYAGKVLPEDLLYNLSPGVKKVFTQYSYERLERELTNLDKKEKPLKL